MHIDEGFDPIAYKLLVKIDYDPNKPLKLGKLLLDPAKRHRREGLGYKKPPLVYIFIRRVSNNYVTVEDKHVTSNKRPSVFDRLGSLTVRISVFKRLGPLKNKNKPRRNYKSMKALIFSKAQYISKYFQSLIIFRMRWQTNLMVLFE